MHYIQKEKDIHPFHIPSKEESGNPFGNLVKEVIENGRVYDLVCGGTFYLNMDGSFAEVYPSMNKLIKSKMDHPIHKEMNYCLRERPECLLALILSAKEEGSMRSLRDSQRRGDYGKWKFFDLYLGDAIEICSRNSRPFNCWVYCGWHGVKFQEKCVANGYFPTFVSSCTSLEKARTFAKGRGVLMEFDRRVSDGKHGAICCGLDWISGKEGGEVLFSRSKKFCFRGKCVKKRGLGPSIQEFKITSIGLEL